MHRSARPVTESTRPPPEKEGKKERETQPRRKDRLASRENWPRRNAPVRTRPVPHRHSQDAGEDSGSWRWGLCSHTGTGQDAGRLWILSRRSMFPHRLLPGCRRICLWSGCCCLCSHTGSGQDAGRAVKILSRRSMCPTPALARMQDLSRRAWGGGLCVPHRHLPGCRARAPYRAASAACSGYTTATLLFCPLLGLPPLSLRCLLSAKGFASSMVSKTIKLHEANWSSWPQGHAWLMRPMQLLVGVLCQAYGNKGNHPY